MADSSLVTELQVRNLANATSTHINSLKINEAEGFAAAAGTAAQAAQTARDEATAITGLTGEDAAVATLTANPSSETRAALANVLRERTVISANEHGVKADGSTNDAPAWNALIASLPPGSTVTWVGRSVLKSHILWKTGVSLVGQGWGRSILATVDTTGTKHFSAIKATSGDGFSETNTLKDITFKDFEVDGSGLAVTSYSIGSKALYMQFLERCQIRNLYIHDIIATGLGIDFLPGCIIDGVLTERCGRLNDGGGGGAGIGIGTGAWEREELIISNCTTRDGGKWGIFIEKQADKPHYSKGIVISNCIATGNANGGFNDSGGDGALFVNCSSIGNKDGFSTRYDARNGRIENCVLMDNTENGIYVPDECKTGGWVISNNTIGRNGRGIYLDSNLLGMAGMTIADNDVFGHTLNGIYGKTATAGLPFTDLVVRGNRVHENGHSGGSTARGIKFDANIDRALFSGNRVYDRQTTQTQIVGMEFSSVAAYVLHGAQVVNNDFSGNKSVGFRFQAHTLTDVRVSGNAGFVTETSGTATIPDGAKTLSVPHGLVAAPTSVQIGKRSTEDVWVSSRTATTITLERAATVGTLGVDWSAAFRP